MLALTIWVCGAELPDEDADKLAQFLAGEIGKNAAGSGVKLSVSNCFFKAYDKEGVAKALGVIGERMEEDIGRQEIWEAEEDAERAKATGPVN